MRGSAMTQETVHDFQWDPAKAQSNARKHGVTFDQAATVFLDALALTVYDEANSQNEAGSRSVSMRAARSWPWRTRDHGTVQCSDAHHLCLQGHKT
jgi:hypothetical protein